jgi:hypothetical protein
MPTYRQLHKDQLRQNKPALYRELKRDGALKAHLDEIAESARRMHETIVRQMAERHPYDPAEWKGERGAWEGWLHRTADELVLHDRVLVPDEETEKAMREGGYTD